MSVVLIGEEEEYARRLVKYLETRIPSDIQLQQFTSVERFLEFHQEVDLYVLGEAFYGEIAVNAPDHAVFDQDARVISICNEETKEGFCRYHSPKELEEKIYAYLKEKPLGPEEKRAELCAIYAPFYQGRVKDIAKEEMKAGELYLGLEDYCIQRQGQYTTGDLGYYIQLREDNIIDRLGEMVYEEEDCFFLESPQFFFDIKELTMDDFRWFFEKIKEQDQYSKIIIGLGNGILSSMKIFSLFDRVLVFERALKELRGESVPKPEFCFEVGRKIEEVLCSDWAGCRDRVERIGN